MSSTNVYHGSCHCGDVKYQLRLAFPPSTSVDRVPGTFRIYKCNCSTCQKMGMFHCRPAEPSEDFILTSPASIEELGDYRAFSKTIGWYFCKKCGVRTFGLGGKWAQEDLNVDQWAGRQGGDGKVQKVWRTKPLDAPGRDGTPLHYVSVNGVTLEGVDLINWHKKGWVGYVENLDEGKRGELRFGEPFPGGCY